MKRRTTLRFAVPFLFVLGASSLRAQTPAATPDENPEGNTGALKAQITTGGSYDAHSGNATRMVNDLHLPGALGVYGLDFTRYWNSIPNNYSNSDATLPSSFGASGWSHSWEWHAVYGEEGPEPILGTNDDTDVYNSSITITFPDGHANKYKITRTGHGVPGAPGDPRFGPPYSASEQNGFAGFLYDELKDMAGDGSEFWLYRADGGAVHFVGTSFSWEGNHQWWYYRATEIFDPHGLRTELQYDGNDNLKTVLQDGGRSLTLTWGYGPGSLAPVIRSVQTGGYAGLQTVTYNYNPLNTGSATFTTLTSVDYPEDAHAVYTYGNYFGDDQNSGPYSNEPLLKFANDPHYAGAMTRIFYTYIGGSCPVSPPGNCNCVHDYFQAVATGIAAEKSGDYVQFGQHVTASSFAINCFDGTRLETNGFGAWRKFYFGNSAGPQGSYTAMGYNLVKLTDFTNQYPLPANLPADSQNWYNGQPRQIWDGRNIETEAIVTPGDFSGQPGEIHHVTADGSYQIFDRVNPGASAAQDFTRVPNRFNHWLFSHRDELSHTTNYVRDSRRRVKDIVYGDTSEHFTYKVYANGETFNQVETHTLPSGAVRTYVYDETTHRLMAEYNSVDGLDARKEYTYDSVENIATVSDGRSRSAHKDFSTRMTYNGRHQILTVEYAGMNNAPDNPKVQYGYDPYGNCEWISDELATTPQDPNHTKRYTYDSYRRCISYSEPLSATTSRSWNWYYDRYFDDSGYRSPFSHTSKEWRVQVEPAYNAAGDRRLSAHKFDYNNRIIEEATGLHEAADGNWYADTDTELHHFSYDPNGQKETYTDPRGRLTTYTYDNRNRLKDTIETKRADQSANPTTTILYDLAGNKTDVTFPDTRSQHWRDYDAFGQPGRFIDERNNTTNLSYIWGPMKKLYTVTTHRAKDGGGIEDQVTVTSYDDMGRPQTTVFPDGSNEYRTYECSDAVSYLCDQVHRWYTRNGQIKTIAYDARGRESSHTWSDATPGVTRVWDDANRLSHIQNAFSQIDYTYDFASQPQSESNNVTGSGGAAVTGYLRYPSGEVSQITYPYGRAFRSDYTARGQLRTMGVADGNSNWVCQMTNYYYQPDGKVDHQDYVNGVTTVFGYDARGFTSSLGHKRWGSQNLSYRDYYRDNRDRITWFVKSADATVNPKENGLGDVFYYDAEGQLTDSVHEAANYGGDPAGGQRWEHFNYDALGNRAGDNIVGLRGWLNFSRRDNGLNQYSSWSPSAMYHDDNYPGWSGPGNGVMMADGWITASYNALNQPVAIWSPAMPSGAFTWFGYDPLGRCVKRWVGPSGGETSNPATYLYYDGWNLIQEGPASGGLIWDGVNLTQSGAGGAARVYLHGARVDEIVFSVDFATMAQAFHQYDASGHSALLTDWNANIVEQYSYDAFGLPYFYDRWGTDLGYSVFGNRFLFTGREWMSDLKLYDFRNRLYQPELGRFLQPDPKQFAAGDYNLYRYCHNDPVNRSDPTGLDFILLNDSGAAFQNGHNAVLVGNDKDGWTYYSKDGRSGSTTAPFRSLADFQKSDQSQRYDRGLNIPTTADKDKAMKDYGDRNYNRPYDTEKNNCADLTNEVGRAGDVGIDSPKKGGVFYRNATSPNKQYDQLKEKYKDKATDVKPHVDKKNE
ncbi:MAG: hypothetical protein QOH88_3161 [Verrucomicrobiota bacterium]|jgi:RHS repeat-associated protein